MLPHHRGRMSMAAALGILVAALTGCAATDPAGSAPSGGDALEGSITVFAAASLTATFTDLADRFEAAHPGTTVSLNVAGSSDLATQIVEGAPADVFASADTTNMAKVTAAGLTDGDPVDVATNTLEIAVPPGNPANIRDLTDLATPGLQLVICSPEVPCGAATATVATAAGVTLRPVSEESSVTDVLGKITSGQADAGLVYVTDVQAADGAVDGIEFAEAGEAVNTYPIAALTDSDNAPAARAFIDFVTGSVGRSVLTAAGFGTP